MNGGLMKTNNNSLTAKLIADCLVTPEPPKGFD